MSPTEAKRRLMTCASIGELHCDYNVNNSNRNLPKDADFEEAKTERLER